MKKEKENIGNKEAAATVERKIKNLTDDEILRTMDVLCAIDRCYDPSETKNIKFSIPEAINFTAVEIASRGLIDE